MSKQNISITILGAGNMGTALAHIVGSNGYKVKIWNYEGDTEPLDQINDLHENKKYLAGVSLSNNIIVEKNLENAVHNAKIIFFVIPSGFITDIIKRTAKFISPKTICVDVSKGLDKKTLELTTTVFKKFLPSNSQSFITAISGPAIAVDMVKGGFTAMNISSKNNEAIKLVKKVLCNDNLRLKETPDLIGTEIAGSFKNIYAMAIGMADHYEWPMNTKAAIIVLAIQEMAAIIKKMGGHEKTATDLAGLGDLICTALSNQSRNRRFGQCFPKHLNKELAAKEVGQVVEGIEACKITLALAKKYKTKMPLAQTTYQIVWKNANPESSLKKLLKQSF